MAVMRDTLDKLASQKSRARDMYICQRCAEREDKETEPNVHNHAAHIFSRNNFSTRWNLKNLITLCYYCHIYWAHRNPAEFVSWVRNKIGEDIYKELEKESKK